MKDQRSEFGPSLAAALLVILVLYGLWHLPELIEYVWPTTYPAPP